MHFGVMLKTTKSYGTYQFSWSFFSSINRLVKTLTNVGSYFFPGLDGRRYFIGNNECKTWLPQGNNPYGSLSNTSSLKILKMKTLIGHAFIACICIENENQMIFYHFVPHKIFVFVELILGHLCYFLTYVPSQPNSPLDNVFHLDQCPQKGDLRPKTRVWQPRLHLIE